MNTFIQYPLPGHTLYLTSLQFLFLQGLSVLHCILWKKTIKVKQNQQPKERRIEEVLKIREVDLLTETGILFIFLTRRVFPRSKKIEYHLIPHEPGADVRLHLYRLCKVGIKWYRTTEQAVKTFNKERNHWLEHSWRMRAQIENVASLSVSTWPHPGKAGSALP